MSQKQALGKGLASLFPSFEPPAGAAAAGASMPVNKDRIPGVTMAMVDEIQVNQYQPRRDFDEQGIEELAASIRANGIIQPLIVRKNAAGKYELIAGERRLRAAKKAGLSLIPVVVRRSTDREALEIALVENIQRQNLNCVDEALAYFQLMEDFSLTQEEVATRVGKDRATVANFLRLLRLSQEILGDLKSGAMTLGHGKALLSIEEPELRLRARKQILESQLSVRETEKLIEELKRATQQADAGLAAADAENRGTSPLKTRMMNLSLDLTRQWSAKVEVKGSERRGKIIIHYASRQDLDRLIEQLHSKP